MNFLRSLVEDTLSLALVVVRFIVIGWYVTGGPKE